MSNFIKWLRRLGPIGVFIATAIGLLATNWAVVVSVLVGIGAACWTLATAWVQNPRVQTGVEVFLAILWTYIGVIFLQRHKTPTSVRVFHDYAYALAYESSGYALDADNPDVIAVTFGFRNVSAGPVKIRVEDLRVILDGRTADHPDNLPREMFLPRVSAKSYRSPAIPWDRTKNRIKGTADITVLYGHPELGYERKLRMRFEILAIVERQTVVAFTAGIMSETDTPYRST